jgi:hypothetical protein
MKFFQYLKNSKFEILLIVFFFWQGVIHQLVVVWVWSLVNAWVWGLIYLISSEKSWTSSALLSLLSLFGIPVKHNLSLFSCNSHGSYGLLLFIFITVLLLNWRYSVWYTKAWITKDTQENNSHRKWWKTITDTRDQERIKLKRRIDEPTDQGK